MKNRFSHSRFAMAVMATCILTFAGCNFNFTMVDGYSFNWTGQTAEHAEQGEFDEGVKKIKIVNKFGDVNVSQADGEPGWSWDAKVWAESQELADLFIDELSMDVQTDGNTQTWTITLPESSSDLNGVKSNLVMKLPADVSATIENRHGNCLVKNLATNITLENGHGNVEFNSVSGKINAVNAHGDLMATGIAAGDFKNSHGDTKVVDSTSDITINSSHGSVRVENIQGSLTFDGGHGQLVALNVGNVTVKNRHGNNEIRSMGENVKVDSEFGDIQLTMNSAAIKSIDLDTSHSSIEVFLPVSCEPSVTMETTHGKMDSEFASSRDSGLTVKLKCRHGDIKLRKSEFTAEASAEVTAESPAESTQ